MISSELALQDFMGLKLSRWNQMASKYPSSSEYLAHPALELQKQLPAPNRNSKLTVQNCILKRREIGAVARVSQKSNT